MLVKIWVTALALYNLVDLNYLSTETLLQKIILEAPTHKKPMLTPKKILKYSMPNDCTKCIIDTGS